MPNCLAGPKVCQTVSQDQKYAKPPRGIKSMPNGLAGPEVCQTVSQDLLDILRFEKNILMIRFYKMDMEMPNEKLLVKGDEESPEADNLNESLERHH